MITTNVDGQFMKIGFAPERFFEVQGNYGEWQCSVPCRQQVFDNEGAVMEMLKEIKDLKIPTDLIPYCPHCGAPMTMHLRVDQEFVQDETWEESYEAYQRFLEGIEDQKVVFLELGVGYNTPTIIRYPFEKMTAVFPKVHLIRLNRDDLEGFGTPKEKTISIKDDMREVLQQWLAD